MIQATPQPFPAIIHINFDQRQSVNFPQLLQPEQFAKIEDHSALRIVDLSSPANYMAGHIEGAVHVAAQEIIDGTPPTPGQLPPIEKLQPLLDLIGYKSDLHIIAVDDEGGGWAGRFLWTLELIGHRNWSYLDGGMVTWKREDYPLSIEIPKISPTHVPVAYQAKQRATLEEIVSNLSDPDFQLWDARGTEEFRGLRSGSARAGHMPGAKHCEWTSLMDVSRNLRIRFDAIDVIKAAGLDPDKPTVTYCQSHHRSGLTWLVGHLLGLPSIKAYDGAWSEWGNRADTPIE